MTIKTLARWLFDREFFVYSAGSCTAYAVVEFDEHHHLLMGWLLLGASLVLWELRRLRPTVDQLFDDEKLKPGIYWVWWKDDWHEGQWDGQDWNVSGSIFSYTIPVGPRWSVPPKPGIPVQP